MEANRKTVFSVEGMSCQSCVKHVGEALRELEGVSRVEVDLANGVAVVEHGEGVAVQTMLTAVREAGYEVSVR